uniref:Uncharacterized protein n=1 Tax=Tanacetum cinerariifolium TaxID=118510 RepID=A0A699JKS1_TANCI|nr:hypothetical protein [Tanacetum cinerariifolium]
MSSSDSTVTYTSISSKDVPFWGIRFFSIEQPDSPEAASQGDDGDDDDGESSRDDADAEEEEDHFAPADSTIVIPTVELVSPPKGTEHVIPPPVDCRDDILEIEMPPRKRLCLSILGSRYEIKESSTDRPTREVGYGIRDTWVDPAETDREIAPMTMGEVNTKVELLALREQPGRARQPGEDARVPDHQDALRDADSHI